MEDLTRKKLLEMSPPTWINIDELLKQLRREFFIGYGRGDGEQGTLRINKIKNEFNNFLDLLYNRNSPEERPLFHALKRMHPVSNF